LSFTESTEPKKSLHSNSRNETGHFYILERPAETIPSMNSASAGICTDNPFQDMGDAGKTSAPQPPITNKSATTVSESQEVIAR